MWCTAAVLLAMTVLCLQASAFSNIVAFGDSLTDDCTMGVSQFLDDALGSDQVRRPVLLSCMLHLLGVGSTQIQLYSMAQQCAKF